MQKAANSERNMQLMMRSMTSGILSERDLLLQYSLGEFMQELSLFLQECEARKKELEKVKK